MKKVKDAMRRIGLAFDDRGINTPSLPRTILLTRRHHPLQCRRAVRPWRARG
jgi:hypothetical protein